MASQIFPRSPAWWLSTGLGAGLVPRIPGTVGTLWGILLYWALRNQTDLLTAGFLLAFLLLAVAASSRTEKLYGQHDNPQIVVDEVVGYLVTVWAIPFTWSHAALGFLLFRFFDIVKPFPIRWVDRRCPGGWGVVLDDALAGVFGNLCLRAAMLWFGAWI